MLLLSVRGTRRIILADCGDLAALSHGMLRRVTDLLVSHGHLWAGSASCSSTRALRG